MKKEIIEHVKNLKDQGANIKVDEDQIDDLINKIFDKKYEKYAKRTYIESEIDKFLEKNEYRNISTFYNDDDGDKIKIDTEKITKLLKKLRNKFINIDEFNEEYNKFKNNVKKLKKFKSKNNNSFSTKPKKIIRYKKDLINIVDLYSIKSDSATSKKGEGLKILTNKQMLNRLPVLLAQIEAGNNPIKLKNEARQILYSLYRSKTLTKTVYNKLIKLIR